MENKIEYPGKCNVCGRELLNEIDFEIHKIYHNTDKEELQNLKNSQGVVAIVPANTKKPCTEEVSTNENPTDNSNNGLSKTVETSVDLRKTGRLCSRELRNICSSYNLRTFQMSRQPRERDSLDKSLANLNDEEICKKCLSGDNPTQCGVCFKQLASQYSLKIHVGQHLKERPFQCDTCKKSFMTTTNLKQHQRSHKNEKTCQCSFCSEKFLTKKKMRKHKLVHYATNYIQKANHVSAGYKPETNFESKDEQNSAKICIVCNRTFKRWCHLARHQRKHRNLNAVLKLPAKIDEHGHAHDSTQEKSGSEQSIKKICLVFNQDLNRWSHQSDCEQDMQKDGSKSNEVSSSQVKGVEKVTEDGQSYSVRPSQIPGLQTQTDDMTHHDVCQCSDTSHQFFKEPCSNQESKTDNIQTPSSLQVTDIHNKVLECTTTQGGIKEHKSIFSSEDETSLTQNGEDLDCLITKATEIDHSN